MTHVIEVKVPDIGDFKNIPVIEIFVQVGDTIKAEDSLLTLESDKSTMDIPSPQSGVVKQLKVKSGDRVSEGHCVILLEVAEVAEGPVVTQAPQGGLTAQPPPVPMPAVAAQEPVKTLVAPDIALPPRQLPTEGVDSNLASAQDTSPRFAHASPSVRQFARELGVDLFKVTGHGPKSRILREDVQHYVKSQLTRSPETTSTGGMGFNFPPIATIDFSKFGVIETKAMSRIKKLSGSFLHRNWVSIPHVTQHDEADITDLEAFRKAQSKEAEKKGIKLTLLAFLVKASVVALKQFPEFNASLSADAESLILKHYFHVGVAVDTPQGLVVPVLRDADKKGLLDIAQELALVSDRVRQGKIAPNDLQGGCFSISSLGGIGGTQFTPIINAPEVAILGVGRATMKPVWDQTSFQPRLMLPLSLSYDHRVIDGAQGARFISFLSQTLSDIRRLVL